MIVMKENHISRRHRILIAAAAAVALGPRARIRDITLVKPEAPKLRHVIEIHIRTARREKTHEVADIA